MAEESSTTTTTTSASFSSESTPTTGLIQELTEIRTLLWGPKIVVDIFRRWSQGFQFSDSEPSALVQHQGGPCAVIVPVQAYLLKMLLMETSSNCFSDLAPDACNRLLIRALCDILKACHDKGFRIVTLSEVDGCVEAIEEEMKSMDHTAMVTNEIPNDVSLTDAPQVQRPLSGQPPLEWTPDEFHERLSVIDLNSIDDVDKYYTQNYTVLRGQYGLLLFVYTVMLTKSLDNIVAELLDTSEPLIHNVYGYASQGLINLMLTGRAVPHVWDNDKDVGGLKLRGISEQSDIGFITLMEQMRYCTVGSFYKNPKHPVWVMGSETHLSVLFSNEKTLVSTETNYDRARRIFKSFDPDGNNFIASQALQEVLCALDLVSEPEYVDIMQQKLDPEGLGIILLNSFMEEFFADDKRSTPPDTFELMHYNGIPGSNANQKVKYNKGAAILLECDLKGGMCNASNPMLTCLQTKWPNIEVNWNDPNRTPSLN